ncbi:MAG TPA: hypothetical protein VF765_31100 [Polyangiaceae bacterium]
MKPTIGRIVLFAFIAGNGEIIERPAIVVRTWEKYGVQLQVFTDGSNDNHLLAPAERDQPAVWRTSVIPADDHDKAQVGRWRWPPTEKLVSGTVESTTEGGA